MTKNNKILTLADAEIGKEVVVKGINTNDAELNSFLFTLGCYTGESIVVVSRIGTSLVVAIKDGRYNIDQDLAEAICI